jgi:RHS repeat-associated protein
LNGVTRATWSNYDAFGAAGNVQYQNGVNTAYTFNVMHYLTGLVTTKSDVLTQTVFQNLTFDWYATQTATNGLVLGGIQDNRQSTVINGVNTSETQEYAYDALYRLASARGVWGKLPLTYAYDVNNGGVGIGNPTSFGGVTQRTLTFSGTKLTAASDGAGWSVSNIGYDTSGNMTNKTVTLVGTTKPVRETTTWHYTWTDENRLASATYAGLRGGATATMLYDDAGQRFMKHRHADSGPTFPDETTTYIGKTYEQWTSADPTAAPDKHTLHLFGNGQLIMSWTRQGSVQAAPDVGTFFYHRNHINSSAVITDINGAEVSRMVYTPFGELSQNHSTGSDVVSDQYTGQVYDPETGLYYCNARYYDPMVGRFLSADPLVGNPSNAPSYNRYAYTRNNPITNTDPTGLCPDDDPYCIGQVPGGGWIGDVLRAASWVFGFSSLGFSHNSGPSGPKPWTPPQVPAGTPSTPLQVDQSSSGNPNGTLPRAQAIDDLLRSAANYLSSPEYAEEYESSQRVREAQAEKEWGISRVKMMAPYMEGAFNFTGKVWLGAAATGATFGAGSFLVGGGSTVASIGTISVTPESFAPVGAASVAAGSGAAALGPIVPGELAPAVPSLNSAGNFTYGYGFQMGEQAALEGNELVLGKYPSNLEYVAQTPGTVTVDVPSGWSESYNAGFVRGFMEVGGSIRLLSQELTGTYGLEVRQILTIPGMP